MGEIDFTPERAKKFVAARDEAVKKQQTVFQFEGQDVLVVYAKYVIEFLEQKGMLR